MAKYARAAEVAPKSAGLYVNIGTELYRLGKFNGPRQSGSPGGLFLTRSRRLVDWPQRAFAEMSGQPGHFPHFPRI